MVNCKKEILLNICYTDLVYHRINKKLNVAFSKDEIEKMVLTIIKETDVSGFYKKGKKYLYN